MSDDQKEIIQSDTKSISVPAESESKDVEPRPSKDSQKNENTTEAKVESDDLISVEENSPDEILVNRQKNGNHDHSGRRSRKRRLRVELIKEVERGLSDSTSE